MDFLDKLAVVVELAAMYDDLDRRERRALLDVAHHVDKRRNLNVGTNARYHTRGAPGGGRMDSVMVVEPSRLARLAGCDKPDCKVCTKEIAVHPGVVAAMAARMDSSRAIPDHDDPKGDHRRELPRDSVGEAQQQLSLQTGP